jgi:hypothetical protein
VPVRMSAGRWNRAETASTATPSTSANSPQMADSELITFVHNELLPALKEINGSLSPQHQAIKSVFEDANNYMKSGPSMLAIIEKLEEAINFHDFKTRAHLGDVYEQLLSDLRSAGVLHLPRSHAIHGGPRQPQSQKTRHCVRPSSRHRELSHHSHRPLSSPVRRQSALETDVQLKNSSAVGVSSHERRDPRQHPSRMSGYSMAPRRSSC